MKKISLFLLSSLLFFVASATAATNISYPKFQVFTDAGVPLSGGKVYSYECGTTTPKATCADITCSSYNANPTILNSRGEADIFGEACYKFNVTTSADIQVTGFPKDNVYGIGGAYNLVSLNDTYSCDLAAGINTITTDLTSLVVDCAAVLANGVTVTILSTTSIEYAKNGSVDGTSGGAVENLIYANSTSAPIAPWNQKIYGANLNVTYGNGIAEAYPERFGSIDGTSDEVQINLAITALNKGDVILNGQSYTVDASITGATNINLRGREGITTITQGAIDIYSFHADTKTNITVTGIKWVGFGITNTTEKLVFFDTCTDVTSKKNIYTDTTLGLQLQDCTRAKSIEDTFIDVLRRADYTGGYGVLVNQDNADIQVINASCNNVERHCVYFSAGCNDCIVTNSVATNSSGTPFTAYTASAQNTSRNIQFTNLVVHQTQEPGDGSNNSQGIDASGNIDGLIISNNHIYDVRDGSGIFVQNGAADANTLKNVIIDNNIINTVENGAGIEVLNGSNITITNNQLTAIDVVGGVYSGISVQASGVGVGSFVDSVFISKNVVDTGLVNLLISGADATHKATNIVIGDNLLTNGTAGRFGMGDTAYITYKTTWDSFKPTYYVDNVAAAQIDTVMNSDNGSAFVATTGAFIAPFSGVVYSVYGKVNGTITNDSILIEPKIAGVDVALGVTISAGDLYEKKIFELDTAALVVTEGDVIELTYTTPAGFLPVTLEVVAGLEIIRDVNE